MSERSASDPEDYRLSHASENHGRRYATTYQIGYYATLWKEIERPLLERLFDDSERRGARSCLDFACGTGRITAVAETHFASCVGVDVSAAMLEVARQACARARIEQIDITTEPLEGSFDVITAFRFFLNAGPELRTAALAAMKRLLAPEGRLIANVHVNRSSLLGVAYRVRNRLLRRRIANTLSHDELTSLLRQAGFRIVETHWYGFYPRIGWRFDWLTRQLLVPVERLFQSVRVIPRAWAGAFIVVCEHGSPEKAPHIDASRRR